MQLPPSLIERFRADLEALGGSPGKIGIAVSGGPDSLALLLLAYAAYPGAVEAATVDHGLRPESADEAALVADICARLGIPHLILTVEVERRGEGLQASARKARYSALGGWIRERGIDALLTAHHCDDQAETLVMRLLRGSGVGGLAGVRSKSPFPAGGENALLLRPLLGWRRSELAAVVAEAGLEAVDDPSNRDEAYDRVRVRRLLSEAPWLEADAIARSAAALAEAEEALGRMALELVGERVEEQDGTILLRSEDLPAEMRRRLLLYCLRRIQPDAAPRGEQLTALDTQLREGRTVTLAEVKCSGSGDSCRFEPAPPRRERQP